MTFAPSKESWMGYFCEEIYDISANYEYHSKKLTKNLCFLLRTILKSAKMILNLLYDCRNIVRN